MCQGQHLERNRKMTSFKLSTDVEMLVDEYCRCNNPRKKSKKRPWLVLAVDYG